MDQELEQLVYSAARHTGPDLTHEAQALLGQYLREGVTLRQHQRLAVRAMVDMEANHALSRAHIADMLNGEGEASEVIGPVAACTDAVQAEDALRGGGILADEPGLGKTLSMLCLTKLSCPPRAWLQLQGDAETDNIDAPGAQQHPAANVAESASASGSNIRPNSVPTGTSGLGVDIVAPTLIVLPNETILEQWEDEMRRFLRPEHMECVGRYLCPAGQPRGDATANQWASVAAMLRRSVTLTTVAQLRREEHLHTAELYRVTRALSTRPTRARAAKAKAGAMTDTDKDIAADIRTQSDDDGKGICLAPLLRVRWWRVVIDEVQEVEGAATLAAKCARALTARMRWGVSGTPITRGLADLRGLLLFLAPSDSPLTSTKWWVHNVLEPLKALRGDGASSSRERAQHILARLARGIMWRTQFSTVARSMQLPAQISLEPRVLPSSLLELLVYQPKHAAFMNRARRQLRGYRDDTTLLSTKELRSLLGGKGSPITALLKGANHAGLSGPSASAKVLTARNAGNHMLVQLFLRSREECTKRLADTASALAAAVCDTAARVTLLQAALGLLLAGEKSGLSVDPLLTLRIASQLDMVCKTCPDNAPLHNAVRNVRQSQRYTFLLCAFKVAAKARARMLSGAAQTAMDGMPCASRVRASETNLPILPARALRCIVSFIASVAEDAFARCRSNLVFRSVQDCAQLVQELDHCSSGVDTHIASLESTMMHINPVRLASWEYGRWPRLESRPHDDIAVDDTHIGQRIHRTIRHDARPRKLSCYKLQVHPQHFRDSIAALGREIEEVGQACQSEQGRGILGETRRQPSKRAKALCKVVEFVGNIRPQDKRTMIGASEHLLWRYVYGTVSNDLKHSEWMWTCASCSCSNHPSADRCANCFSTRHGPAMDAGLGAGSHMGTGVNVSDAASAAADAAETAGTGAHVDGAMASNETVIVVREEVPVSGLLSMSTLGKLLSELVVKLLVARFKFIRMLRSFCQAVAEDKLPDVYAEAPYCCPNCNGGGIRWEATAYHRRTRNTAAIENGPRSAFDMTTCWFCQLRAASDNCLSFVRVSGVRGKGVIAQPLLLRFLKVLHPAAHGFVLAIRDECMKSREVCEGIARHLNVLGTIRNNCAVVCPEAAQDNLIHQQATFEAMQHINSLHDALESRRCITTIACVRQCIGIQPDDVSVQPGLLREFCAQVNVDSLQRYVRDISKELFVGIPTRSAADRSHKFGDPVSCSVCGLDVDPHVKVLPCAHVICTSCQASDKWRCPSCETGLPYPLRDAPFIVDVDPDVNALPTGQFISGFGTKIDAIVHDVMKYMQLDTAAIEEAAAAQPGACAVSGVSRPLSPTKPPVARPRKSIIFSQFPEVLKIISSALAANKVRFTHLKNHGPSTAGLVASFKSDPNFNVLLLPLKTSNHGLSLSGAQRVFIVEPSLIPALEAQATARVRRLDQHETTFVHRYVTSGTVEHAISRFMFPRHKALEARYAAAPTGVEGSWSHPLTRDDLFSMFNSSAHTSDGTLPAVALEK